MITTCLVMFNTRSINYDLTLGPYMYDCFKFSHVQITCTCTCTRIYTCKCKLFSNMFELHVHVPVLYIHVYIYIPKWDIDVMHAYMYNMYM